jgi:protein-S-isoprenylcysteine O-methyltransferase Ste14
MELINGVNRVSGNEGSFQKFARTLSEHRTTISRLFVVIAIVFMVFFHEPWRCSTIVHLSLKSTGFLLVTICVTGRIWSSTYIGGRKTKHLVCSGPYSIVRHPLYMFSFIGSGGIGISSMNTYMIVALGAFLLFYYPGVIYYEESKMVSIHGEEYLRYRSRVHALIPKPSLYHSPDEIVIKPAKFHRDLIHSMYFMLIYILFEIINYGHMIR